MIFSEARQTFESSLDDATEAFVSDDLVEAITNRRQSDVDVDIRSHFSLHRSAQRQPTRCQQYRLSQLVKQILHLHKQSQPTLQFKNVHVCLFNCKQIVETEQIAYLVLQMNTNNSIPPNSKQITCRNIMTYRPIYFCYACHCYRPRYITFG